MRSRKKKQQLFFRRFIFFIVLVAMLGISLLIWLWWRTQQVQMVKYTEFGIPIPSNYPIHGIDVSRYQDRISWESVQKMDVDGIKLGFAFIKATEGTNNVDPYFKRNWKKSKDAGIIRGAYHFFVPAKSGKLQAENFIRRVNMESGDLPPVLDIEQMHRVQTPVLQRELLIWLRLVEQHYGVRPIVYTNISFYKKYLQGKFEDYPLWVAHYLEPHQPRITRDWLFWQHSETGRVNGIISKVDFNVFNGDSLAFRSLLVP